MSLLKLDPDEAPAVNMTPMIDIVFNLLIFFLLGSTYLNEDRSLELELPRVVAAAPLTDAPDEIMINVLVDGKITVEGRELSVAELEALLTAARKNYPDQTVAVRGDRAALYERVLNVVAICRRAGIARVDFLAREE